MSVVEFDFSETLEIPLSDEAKRIIERVEAELDIELMSEGEIDEALAASKVAVLDMDFKDSMKILDPLLDSSAIIAVHVRNCKCEAMEVMGKQKRVWDGRCVLNPKDKRLDFVVN